MALGILSKLGVHADAVANGIEAVKALESLPYDLVLMDCQMPEMDGYEAAAQIRDPQSNVRNHDISIIAMTAHTMRGDREKCLEAGMNDYLPKPVDPWALAEMLEKWLTGKDEAAAGTSEPQGTNESASGRREETVVPIFDKAAIMRRLMDDEELARTLVQDFLQDIPMQTQRLKGFLDTADLPAARRLAHSIKGAAANLGGERLQAAAFELENACQAGNLDAVKGLMQELQTQLERFQEAVEEAF